MTEFLFILLCLGTSADARSSERILGPIKYPSVLLALQKEGLLRDDEVIRKRYDAWQRTQSEESADALVQVLRPSEVDVLKKFRFCRQRYPDLTVFFIQDELRLTESQCAEIDRLHQQWLVEWAHVLAGKPNLFLLKEFNEFRFESFSRRHDRWVQSSEEILTDVQRKRFSEVSLQIRAAGVGLQIFQEERMRETLRLSEPQLEIIQAWTKDRQSIGLWSSEQNRRQFRRFIYEVLSEPQRAKWLQLAGECYRGFGDLWMPPATE